MKNQTFTYGLASLIAGGMLTGLLFVNRTQAQTSPNPSSSSAPMGMGMMNQQQADQHFIQMMIPHHQGAIDMANLASTKATHPELKQLAEAIKTSQSQEIQEMKAWYKQWYGTEVPATSGMGMPMQSRSGKNQGNSCHGAGMMPMMGMMNMDLTALKNAKNFDQVFITEMIPHHQMAVMMSAKVLTSPHPELRNLAKAIIQAQTAEIEEMFQWNTDWFR
jgi:uncharacterized protein (DUF305 family)